MLMHPQCPKQHLSASTWIHIAGAWLLMLTQPVRAMEDTAAGRWMTRAIRHRDVVSGCIALLQPGFILGSAHDS